MNVRKLSLIAVLMLAVGLGYFLRTTFTPVATTAAPASTDVTKEVDDARAKLKALGPENKAFVYIAKIIKPSVVSVITIRKEEVRSPFDEEWPFDFPNPFGEGRGGRAPQKREYKGLGSGVIVDKEGHVLTNNHVVEGAVKTQVVLSDDSRYDAEIVGTDPKSDLAVIKMKDCPSDKLVPAVLGDSDKVEVGQSVLAVGAPFGLTQSVSAGIVSALGRTPHIIQSPYGYENFIQTDAAINRGNSGGPLVDYSAEVIGLSSAIITGTGDYAGVGFAIPSNLARRVMTQLIKSGRVVRGYLGVEIREVADEDVKELKLPRKEGVYVNKVFPGTPAEEAGLRDKDVILSIDGRETAKPDVLRSIVADTTIGKSVKLHLLRDGKPMDIPVTVKEQPSEAPIEAAATYTDPQLGITVQTLTPEIAAQVENGDYKNDRGVLVTLVEKNSPAARAGIRQLDLIKEIGSKPVTSVQEYQQARKNINVTRGVLMLVKKGQTQRLVVVK
jgi:serine protease Do